MHYFWFIISHFFSGSGDFVIVQQKNRPTVKIDRKKIIYTSAWVLLGVSLDGQLFLKFLFNGSGKISQEESISCILKIPKLKFVSNRQNGNKTFILETKHLYLKQNLYIGNKTFILETKLLKFERKLHNQEQKLFLSFQIVFIPKFCFNIGAIELQIRNRKKYENKEEEKC